MSSTPERGAAGEPGNPQSARPGEWTGTSQGTLPGQDQRGGAAPGGVPAQPYGAPGPQYGVRGPASPVNEAETRVTGRRVVQYAIDYILVGIIPGLAYWLLDRGSGVLHGFGWALATVIAIVVYLYYWVLRPNSHTGQTFGMQLLGLRVISKDGGPANMSQYFVRAILLIIDTLFFGLVGLITILMSKYRQRVGDHAARTLVISTNSYAGGMSANQGQMAGGQMGGGTDPGQQAGLSQPGGTSQPGSMNQPGTDQPGRMDQPGKGQQGGMDQPGMGGTAGHANPGDVR